jgi:acetolactate synthase-like protein
MRHKRKEALRDADLVILAGTVCDFRLNYGKSLPRNGKVISINRHEARLVMVSRNNYLLLIHTILS